MLAVAMYDASTSRRISWAMLEGLALKYEKATSGLDCSEMEPRYWHGETIFVYPNFAKRTVCRGGGNSGPGRKVR